MPKRGPSTIEERLHRIVGQINGIERLIQKQEETRKILIQVEAVLASIQSVKLELVKKEILVELVKNLETGLDEAVRKVRSSL